MLEAYSFLEATITVVPSNDRAPFVLGYANSIGVSRKFVRAYDGEVIRTKDSISTDTLWIEEDTYEFFTNKPSVCEWVVEYMNEDGRSTVCRWEAVVVTAVTINGSGDDSIMRISVEAEGEPVLG